MYVVVEVGDRSMDIFKRLKEKLPRTKRWVTDDYNVYFHLCNHTVVHYVSPNESLHSSFRDHLVRLKRSTKAVNRSVEMLYNSIIMLLHEKGLVPEFILS
ncbi:IS1 family transposase [Candidatus Acidianus copahuensis]|uniref:IS1 family transposase n=1 Tax=Candidatus Acidianus copahuensis TaxID=1160895 RepID=UPI00064F2B2E|nr:IS1 family transposase [Candidatus Acidianus copahuensis]